MSSLVGKLCNSQNSWIRSPIVFGLCSYGPMLHARSPCWVRNFALYYTFICVASHNNIVHYTYDECAALCGRAWGSAALRASSASCSTFIILHGACTVQAQVPCHDIALQEQVPHASHWCMHWCKHRHHSIVFFMKSLP